MVLFLVINSKDGERNRLRMYPNAHSLCIHKGRRRKARLDREIHDG